MFRAKAGRIHEVGVRPSARLSRRTSRILRMAERGRATGISPRTWTHSSRACGVRRASRRRCWRALRGGGHFRWAGWPLPVKSAAPHARSRSSRVRRLSWPPDETRCADRESDPRCWSIPWPAPQLAGDGLWGCHSQPPPGITAGARMTSTMSRLVRPLDASRHPVQCRIGGAKRWAPAIN